MEVKGIIWKKRHNLKGSSVILFTAIFLLSIVSMVPVAHADPSGGLVLWNKLGSDSEVLNSEVGPNGTIAGSSYAYEPAKYGNGYVRKAGGENCVQFPGSVLHNLNHRGTIELWVNPKVPHPVPYQYGFFALVGQPVSGPTVPENRGNIYLYWGDGVTGTGLYGGVRFDDSLAETPSESTQFVATVGVPFHAAICWDIDGIDGTDEKVRGYRDGVVVGSTTTHWNPSGTDLEDNFKLGMNPDAQGFDKFISDNIKVWDYAKTNFSDTRFISSCDIDGNDKNQFTPGEGIYVKGYGLEANTTYRILIQDDPVSEGDTLSADEDPSGPVLWNKLGSLDEVQNSEVGANFVVEGNVGFTDGVFGNGFFSTGHWYLGNRIIIPENGLQLDPQGGTIEAWVMYPQDPIVWAYKYGMFGILDGPYQSGPGRDNTLGQQVVNFIGDGVTGDLYTYYVGVNFGNGVSVEIPNIDQVFQPGDFHHVAIVWEKDGIDGSSNRIRVYIDNVLMGSSDDNNWGTDPDVGNRHTVAKGAGFDDGTPAYVIDNLKVWNYARTDFSDRFNETSSAFEDVTTDADGSFDPMEIWAIPLDANPTADAFDIVADKLDDDPNTGKYNAASDGIDSATTVGFVAPIPELPTIILLSIGLLVLVGYVLRKRF
jgi:hypothetical protein